MKKLMLLLLIFFGSSSLSVAHDTGTCHIHATVTVTCHKDGDHSLDPVSPTQESESIVDLDVHN